MPFIGDSNRNITYNMYGLYKDETEFEQLMKKFCEIIFQKGLTKLEEISKPTTKIRPTTEMEQDLFDHYTGTTESVAIIGCLCYDNYYNVIISEEM